MSKKILKYGALPRDGGLNNTQAGDYIEMETKLIDVTDLEHAEARLSYAGSVLRAGGLVAFPTETVYGLGGDALNPNAAADIYKAKGRPSDNPLIVHIADRSELSRLTDRIPESAERLMDAFWPGPLTMIFEKKAQVPEATTGGLSTVAVRMPDNAATLALIREAGCPLAGPSANLSGRPSPTKWEHVYEDLNGKIDVILQGEPCQVGIESTVLDMTEDIPAILRPGIITPESLSAVTGGKVVYDPALFVNRPRDVSRGASGDSLLEVTGGPAPKAPGMKYRHYAPKAEMILFQGTEDDVRRAALERKEREEAAGKRVGLLLFEGEDAKLVAREFFAKLRELDASGADLILAAALDSKDPVGFSVMNRMLKSAGYHIVEV